MKPLNEPSAEILRAARTAETPPPGARQRVRLKLEDALAAGLPGPDLPPPGAAPPLWWTRAGWLVGVALLVGLGVGVVRSRSESAQPEDQTPPQRSAAVSPTADSREPQLEAAAPPAPETPAPLAPETPAPLAPETPAPGSPAPPRPRPRLTTVTTPSAVTTPSPVVTPPVTAPAEPPAALPAPPDEAPAPDDQLEAETRGLREVHLALRDKAPERALLLLEQQATQFPRGQLGPERAAAGVLALCAFDPPRGRDALERFSREHPGSPLLPRLKKACVP